MELSIQYESVITCPQCGHTRLEVMPNNACQWFYECQSCHSLLRPLEGDCCVFCSFASVPCPPVQASIFEKSDENCCKR